MRRARLSRTLPAAVQTGAWGWSASGKRPFGETCVHSVLSECCPPPPGPSVPAPPARNGRYLGLKSALQGPEGAWVWEQGGQSRDWWEKLQKKQGGQSRGAAGCGPAPRPPGPRCCPRRGTAQTRPRGRGPPAQQPSRCTEAQHTHAGMSEVGAVQLGRVLVELERKDGDGEAPPARRRPRGAQHSPARRARRQPDGRLPPAPRARGL